MGKKGKMPDMNLPIWFDGQNINEALFCEEFLRERRIIFANGAFFTPDGRVTDDLPLRGEIYDKLKFCAVNNIPRKITNILEVLKLEAQVPDFPPEQDRIHVANGTLLQNGTFTEGRPAIVRSRLPVAYNPDAPAPVVWLNFLDDLLHTEDIPTLQEFIGYCLIPSTKGQKMLMLTGKGGEGKSRIGVVLRALLGTNMKTGSVAKVETSNFARADLEHELLMLDDDMKLEALPQTNNIKAIITAELPMDLERKRQQSYQGDLYVRFIGLGNGVLQALHDRSVGFFRRQIILTTKEKDPNRKDDPYIAEKMTAEAEGIFLWALEGLHRLIANDFRFTLSQSALDNLNDAVSDGNNIIDFLASEGYIRFRADYEASSKNLYAVYKQWCDDNALNSLSQKSFGSFLKQNESRYNLEYTNKVNIGGGRFARGFVGIELLQRPFL
ncbi:DNA primase family protein [Streptococcus equinus]|uniref:DNA primase family protein n=1 Tax=Streptococcus equinus TaxID=1335 RepID=UPI0037D87431